MAETKELLDVIHDLMEVCRDGEDGYLHAASAVTDTGTKNYFKEMSLERKGFVQELKQLAERLGERDPDTTGTVAAMLHRTWFTAKADIGFGDQAILNSVESGEDVAKKAYEKAMAATLPGDIRPIVQKQAQRVMAAHDRVRDLRDRKAA